jgi:hypothetical protein
MVLRAECSVGADDFLAQICERMLGPVFSYEELFTRTDQNQTRNVVL